MRAISIVVALGVSLSGCAASQKTFYASPAKIKDTQLCRTYFEAQQNQQTTFATDAAAEAQRRGLTYDECQKKVATEDGVLIATALVATAVGVGIACQNGCGGGGGYAPPAYRQTVMDYDCAGGTGDGPYYIQGPVTVDWRDQYDLDRDNDGIGCEITGDFGA